ncbi:MAG: benzoate/H(+) symporter BenE family transporter [Propionibacteriaceae bacterium]|nr:benzoate/H(+) symporter BenE family transporter [Propionibacteriaceae bacterium]
MRRAVVAGLVTAVVGYTSAFAVVLAGLQGVGATPGQAASGLAVLCVLMGLATILLSVRYRMPVTVAWSTPGAALLATTGAPAGGWPVAVGGFVVVGGLLLLTAAIPWLGRAVAAIPTSIAQAMLAGVLVPLCLVPVRAVVADPAVIGPVIVVWVAMLAWRPRWAAAVAIAAAMVVAVGALLAGGRAGSLPPPGFAFELTAPEFTWAGVVGIAVPLWLVTMASQNVAGAAVLGSFGYRVPWRPSLTVTGAATVLAAPFGGHAINLAAISAALSASPDAGPDPSGRWRAATTGGGAAILLGTVSATVTALVVTGPPGLLPAAAGLALLGTLGASAAGAMGAARGREAAVVTFLVAASGISIAGIGAAFWALLAGLLVRWAIVRTVPPTS